MKLSNLKINNLAYIKKVCFDDKKIEVRILEMGFVPMTKIKILYKNKDLMVINIRDYKVALSKYVCDNIEVI